MAFLTSRSPAFRFAPAMLTLASTPLAAPLAPSDRSAHCSARVRTVAILGDSISAGFTSQNASYPMQLRSLLDERHPGRWEALNYGVNCACATRAARPRASDAWRAAPAWAVTHDSGPASGRPPRRACMRSQCVRNAAAAGSPLCRKKVGEARPVRLEGARAKEHAQARVGARPRDAAASVLVEEGLAGADEARREGRGVQVDARALAHAALADGQAAAGGSSDASFGSEQVGIGGSTPIEHDSVKTPTRCEMLMVPQ